MKAKEKTILVVDDEEGIRDSVCEVLTDEGYRVIAAQGATTAMDLIRKVRPPLVLLDVWMPDVDGIGLLKEIKQQASELPVVMSSGHRNIHTAVEATKLGEFDFIEKHLS